MLKLIRGEIYRLIHKKSTYIYFAVLLVGYFLLAFMRSGGFDQESLVNDALELFYFLPALVGGFLFAAIYTDDLNAKNLITLVGHGLSKTKIVLAKFVLAILFGAVVFALVPLIHCAIYTALGCLVTTQEWAMLYAIVFKSWLATLGFCALASIVVYGLQRTTFAIVTYILLAVNVVHTLLVSALNMLNLNLSDHLLSGITDRIATDLMSNVSVALPFLEYAIYIVIAVILSIVVFRKKEMEF